MSQDDLLSQEEIDALLKGVSGDNEATPSPAAARLRRYDPATQHRVVRDRLHTLDIINERFARQFRMGLFNLMRRTVDITVDGVRYLSYSEFSRNVPVPANINMVALKPLRGSALVVFPPSLVFMVVDNLFGGDGRFLAKSEGREFTNTEQRIIQRILTLAIEPTAKPGRRSIRSRSAICARRCSRASPTSPTRPTRSSSTPYSTSRSATSPAASTSACRTR